MTKSGPERGKQSFNLTSLSPQAIIKEEDSLGVLTVPYDLCKKKTRKAEQKN